MRYAIIFLFLSAIIVVVAVRPSTSIFMRFNCAAVALAHVIVAIAYATQSPVLFGKTSAGQQRVASWIVLWPYFLLARLTLWIYRRANRRLPPLAEVVPGIWFGRRLTRAEVAECGIEFAGVLDLAAEFPRAPLRTPRYLSLPLLDALPVKAADLRTALQWLDENRSLGPLLVHCALGHGRTGSIVVAWLLIHNHVPEAATAVAHLKSLRPGFGMSPAQVASVQEFVR